jgi:hypothetical protein
VQACGTGLKRPGELALADPNGSAWLQAVRSGLRASAGSCGAKEQELGGTGGVDARELRRWSAGRRRSGRPRQAQTREQRRFGGEAECCLMGAARAAADGWRTEERAGDAGAGEAADARHSAGTGAARCAALATLAWSRAAAAAGRAAQRS